MSRSADPSEWVRCFRCQKPVLRDRADLRLDGEWYCRECPGRWSR